MKRIFYTSLVTCILLLTTSCGISENNKDNKNDTNLGTGSMYNITAKVITGTSIQLQGSDNILYSKNDTAMITNNGSILGRMKLNRVEKLGISDWYDREVIREGIGVSYAINMNIDLGSYIKVNESAVVEANISIKDKYGRVFGRTTKNVGWSGFDTLAEFYTQDSKNIEVCLQPIVKRVPKSAMIVIELQDKISGMKFDDICFNINTLASPQKGPVVRTVDDELTIKSINGARYSISFLRVENNIRETRRGGEVNLYDIEYQISYKNKPKNNRTVTCFDKFNKYNISPDLMFDVNADADSTLCTDVDKYATEKIDGNDLLYVTKTAFFSVGESYIYRTNRIIDYSVSPANDYVRLYVYFPEERSARNDKEMLQFNGRYVVYQLKVLPHKTRIKESEGSVK